MKNLQISRNGFIHLYNPKKEGLGGYDIHYINAYKNNKAKKNQEDMKNDEGFAA